MARKKDDALFGTHIREAIDVFTKRDFEDALHEVTAQVTPECAHCWHNWGCGSGGSSSNGESYSRGSLRCCHCGEIKHYEYRSGPQKPIQHGPYYAEILRFPA